MKGYPNKMTLDRFCALPLSVRIRLAVEDAKACERDPKFELNMNVYAYQHGAVCSVCMAGASFVKRCGAMPKNVLVYDYYGTPVPDEFEAIDYVRTGQLELIDPSLVRYNSLIRKHYNEATERAPWWVYLRVADRLAKAGL